MSNDKQQFVGTKIITAWPQQGLNSQPGFGVQYEDGYTSWSPREKFVKAYIPLGLIAHLSPHQQRVIAERAELTDRLQKLQAFFDTETYAELDDAEKSRLTDQAIVMGELGQILDGRIAAFTS